MNVNAQGTDAAAALADHVSDDSDGILLGQDQQVQAWKMI